MRAAAATALLLLALPGVARAASACDEIEAVLLNGDWHRPGPLPLCDNADRLLSLARACQARGRYLEGVLALTQLTRVISAGGRQPADELDAQLVGQLRFQAATRQGPAVFERAWVEYRSRGDRPLQATVVVEWAEALARTSDPALHEQAYELLKNSYYGGGLDAVNAALAKRVAALGALLSREVEEPRRRADANLSLAFTELGRRPKDPTVLLEHVTAAALALQPFPTRRDALVDQILSALLREGRATWALETLKLLVPPSPRFDGWMARIKAQLAQLRLVAFDEPGARLLVDGAPRDQSEILLDPGIHRFEFVRGTDSLLRLVAHVVAGQRRSYQVFLRRYPGLLEEARKAEQRGAFGRTRELLDKARRAALPYEDRQDAGLALPDLLLLRASTYLDEQRPTEARTTLAPLKDLPEGQALEDAAERAQVVLEITTAPPAARVTVDGEAAPRVGDMHQWSGDPGARNILVDGWIKSRCTLSQGARARLRLSRPESPPPPEPIHRALSLVAGSVGGAGLVVGGVLLGISGPTCGYPTCASIRDTGTAGAVVLGLSGAVAVGGLVGGLVDGVRRTRVSAAPGMPCALEALPSR